MYNEQPHHHRVKSENVKSIPTDNFTETNSQKTRAMDQSVSKTIEMAPKIPEFVDFQDVPFDVPKLAVVNHYKPPNVKFNEMFKDEITKPTEQEVTPTRVNIQPTFPPFLPTPFQPNRTMSKTKNLPKRTKGKV